MTTDDIPDYYAEFGIDPSATADQVSGQLDRAFRTWSSRASRAPDAKKRRQAEDKVELISEARKELLDRARRQVYDRRLNQARRPDDSGPGPRPHSPPQPGRSGRDWVGHARRLMSEGDHEGALYELRQAVHHDERNGEAWRLLGSLHAGQGQLTDAVQEFRRALALSPGDALIHVLIARVYERTGDPVTAAGWYLAAVRLAPHQIDHRIAAARNLQEAGRHDEALSHYERVLVERPGNAVVRNEIGRIWTLRAEESMSWHPERQRYVVASETGASTVTHCVEQALAVGISDDELRDVLNSYREDASRARTRTWRWYKSMAWAMAACCALIFVLPQEFSLPALAGLLGLPIAMGVKPRWRHNYNDLPPDQKPQTGRAS
ncbi:tetratricopeptide repeat protein [Streptomyces sp. NPDC006743]|uniref:tetratricopeptide repeat protein n=1 Tax=Streptomyces sp. NPDC006743 TaxID=3154480 RepID=UPI003455E17C